MTPCLAVLAAIAVLGGCGGRAPGLLGPGTGLREGGSSGNGTVPDGSVVVVDSSADATEEGSGTVDATEGLEASGSTNATDGGAGAADIVIPCGPAATGTYFVDPSAGHDDDGGNGAHACPFKSLTHTLSLVGDAGAPVTVEIVNTSVAPTLNQATGEVFPITVPRAVTITVEDTTKNAATVVPAPVLRPAGAFGAVNVGICGNPAGCAYGFFLPEPSARLSHLIIDGQNLPGQGRGIVVANGTGSAVDHVTVQNFGATGTDHGIGILVREPPDAGVPTFGPGVVVRNNSESGLHVFAGSVTITGGQGANHSSFTNGIFGIWVEASGSINIEGTNIDPASPNVNDVDVDNNGTGLLLNPSGVARTPNIVRGLHVGQNHNRGISCGLPLTLRGSYVGQNGTIAGGVGVWGACDLGSPVGSDLGRNIFVSNPGGAICGPSGQTVFAVGNIFDTIDCAIGGKLNPTVTCGNTTSIVVSNCTF